MGFEDQFRNVSPRRSLPKEKSRVLEMAAGGFALAKSRPTEKSLEAKHDCPCGGARATSVACDPAVDNGCAEAESSPLKGSVDGFSDCSCHVLFGSLRTLDDAPLDVDEVVLDGEDDGSIVDLNPPESSTPSDQTTEEMADDDSLSTGYETPTEKVFDSFAPGPEELGEFAPLIPGKGGVMRRVPLRRQLQFDSCDSSPSPSDADDDDTAKGTDLTGGCLPGDAEMDEEEKRLVGSLYTTHYNFILSTLLEEQSSSVPESSQSDEDESPRTPSAVPIITGIADTCPGAPIRHVSKARKLDPAICRKLDFS